MASNDVWDFECPQFVDFVAGLDNSGNEDVYFDCKDCQSPENESVQKNCPADDVSEKCLTEEDENRLIDKMTAALSFLENTPKINTVKGKLMAEKFSNFCPQAVKPVLKPSTVPAASRLHRSKSIANLNRIITEKPSKAKVYGLRKRSSSLNDLRTHKKQTYPMTPMCLKRTIIKAKTKVVKTTEEMELEEIAKLQKQLIQHLRHNEITLKKLKLKPRSYVIPKNIQLKKENLMENEGLNPFMGKLNVAEKEARRNIQTLSHAAIKDEAIKIDNIIKNKSAASKTTEKGHNDNNPKKLKNPPISAIVAEGNGKSKIQVTKNNPTIKKKCGFHSGLVFHDSIKKNTTVQPFSFDARIRGNVQNTGAKKKTEVSLSNSSLKLKVDDGKENITCDKSQSTVKKIKRIQNPTCHIVKQLRSNKKIATKYSANSMRGLPLSENIVRN